ncbi:large tegument protein, partial [Clarias magur]
TSVSKYSYYSTGAVQPEVQMVQQGGTHVMVQPFPQPALMVRPASQPAVMVQPSPQPTVVVQPATPTLRVIQPQVFQAAANAI